MKAKEESAGALWDHVASATGVERARCKSIMYALLYGYIVNTCINLGVSLDEVVSVRVAFDDYVEGKV